MLYCKYPHFFCNSQMIDYVDTSLKGASTLMPSRNSMFTFTYAVPVHTINQARRIGRERLVGGSDIGHIGCVPFGYKNRPIRLRYPRRAHLGKIVGMLIEQ
jgi:hypothetical protein